MRRTALLLIGLIFLCLPQAALADPDRCLERGYLHSFDARFATTHTEPCDVIVVADIRWGGRTVHLKAIHPRSMPITDNPVFVGRIRETAAEVGAAMERMGGHLDLDQVTLLFTSWFSPEEHDSHGDFALGDYIAAAHGGGGARGGECPVSYYKDRVRTDGDTFVFTLAHEVFHCIQYKTWRGMPDEGWLTEGTAEYFGHLAKAGYRDNSNFINFDNQIANTPLNNQDYSAVVFYLWLSQAYGPPRVREFIERTRRIQDAIDPDMWIHFGQDYFGSNLRLPDGRAYTGNPRISTTITIHGDETYRLAQSTPYTLTQIVYAFERGKFYEITYTPRPPDTRILWRKADGGAWGPPLTSVSTCDGPQRYRSIWGSTRSREYGEMQISAQPASASACACPAGVWQETQESLKAFVEQSALGGPAPRLLGGGRLLTLSADHTGSFIYQDVLSETPHHDDMWLRQTKSGGTHFTWKTMNGLLLTILTRGADNLVTLKNEMHVKGRVLNETRRAGAQSIGHTFSCDRNGLHLIQNARSPGIPGVPFRVNYNINMHFTRIGGAPRP